MASYLLGYYFSSLFHNVTDYIGALWAVISGALVIAPGRRATLRSARHKLVGDFIGMIIAGAYLFIFPFSVFGVCVCTLMSILVCYLLRMPEKVKIAVIAVVVVMITANLLHHLSPVVNSLLRFVDSSIGTLMAITVAFLSNWLIRARLRFRSIL